MKVRTVNFSPDEFLVGVAGLKASEIGCYWVICSLIYSSGGAIPMDDERLFRVLKEPKYKAMGFITSLINKGKLYLENIDGEACLAQVRCVRELSAAQTRIQNSHKNGKLGGRPSNKNKDMTKPTAETHHDHDHKLLSKDISYTVPVAAREAKGIGLKNGHGSNGASRPSEANGDAALKTLKRERWEQGCIRYMQEHWPVDRIEAAMTAYLENPNSGLGKDEFERASAERLAAIKAGQWRDEISRPKNGRH